MCLAVGLVILFPGCNIGFDYSCWKVCGILFMRGVYIYFALIVEVNEAFHACHLRGFIVKSELRFNIVFVYIVLHIR